jgi:hypothetical protein
MANAASSAVSIEGNVVPMPRVHRSSAGLREALFDEIDRIRNGETDAKKANAVARLAGEVVNTVHLEMEVQRHLASMPKGDEPKPLPRMQPVDLTNVGGNEAA